jgi:hypothetical protein
MFSYFSNVELPWPRKDNKPEWIAPTIYNTSVLAATVALIVADLAGNS